MSRITGAPSADYIHSRTFEGLCALHLSARHGALDCLRVLLEAGADLNDVTTDATTPLFLAVENKHTEVVKFLLQHGANIEGPHCWSGWNSLHQASFQGSTEIMEILLEKGASKNCRDDFGITPLFVAAQYGQLESLRLLVSHGADLNCQAKDRATPLLIAAQEGHLECVKLLLAAGADPNLYCNEDKWQLPIHAAAEMGHVKILELLIPVTDRICDKGKGKLSPVYSAIYGGDEACLELLLKQGFSPNAQECLDFDCRSPMCMIFQKEYFHFTDVLLKYGITLRAVNLGHCLYHKQFALFRRFLRLGCSLPSGEHLSDFLQYSSRAQKEYKQWLPSLLLAGFNPANLMYDPWIFSASEDVLNFILEFTNWSRLPPDVEQHLSQYKEKFTWTPKSHFAFIPPLSHLCRLEIRALLGSERLRSERAIQALPLPLCLQEYLLYLDVLRVSAVPHLQDSPEQGEQGAGSACHRSLRA
ncbi:ankyrin repeat and SOCS box protein 3 isoform X2 [Myiozetetes cayanensis]|uniref:ankyrin repeat and SOCS box protein 3 isoform X2 n=1 Tax=Myiozetetes cayanensis TaxID=478635 RepID=UPI0021607C7F|nr:ankyrin repeat and SOCS box protein 3 isoform X2 [Myiozetetes cayanensis]XP_050170875.1 ankyrin repeat and SOCS box protein 3 isoform X2 [Myiozetetes cayanensis]XP_050170876.1 ankyrin repeat and SOCS box protein 3 isoform X2 [Myiozetetes cayanensis]XP_050170877.1 ankyrin repeat and SOCS box protein 3 isoform X2 [Myiozetetes cayanensis]